MSHPAPKKHPVHIAHLTAIISICAFVIAGFLIVTTVMTIKHRPPPVPRETNVDLIEVWMTIPHISRTYAVPPAYIFERLALDPDLSRRSNISAIAKAKGMTADEVIVRIRQIIRDFQSEHPTRTSPRP